MFGAVTVAVIDWKLLGVVKPAGVVRLTVLVPGVAGSKKVAKFASVAGVEHRRTADDGADVGVGARHRDIHRQPATQRLRLRVGQRRRMEQAGIDPDGLVQRERVGVEVAHVQDEPGRVDGDVARAVVVAGRLYRERGGAEPAALHEDRAPRWSRSRS